MTEQQAIENCRKVKIDKATEPRSGLFHVYVDYFWAVTDDDKILFFNKNRANAPQCNPNENTAKSLFGRLYPELEVRKLPVVYVPINPRDYL